MCDHSKKCLRAMLYYGLVDNTAQMKGALIFESLKKVLIVIVKVIAI